MSKKLFSLKQFLLTEAGKVAWLNCKYKRQGIFYTINNKRYFTPDLALLFDYMVEARNWFIKNKNQGV